jgi:hypothetical protein
VTITAGAASADVTVFADALPLGTVIWSNPGNGSGVTKIVPAVPSPSGVADVFAFQGDGTVQAITSDGLTAWTADVSGALNRGQAVPDFQGGLVVMDRNANSIVKLDGITGQSYSAYTPDGNWTLDCLYKPGWEEGCRSLAVHTDGTIFALQSDKDAGTKSVIGIDPTTGTPKFSVPLDATRKFGLATLGLIIAGDGYAYVPYQSGDCSQGENYHLGLLRVSSGGAYNDIGISDWTPGPHGDPGEIPMVPDTGIITNGDQGVIFTWSYENFTGAGASGMASTTGSAVSLMSAPQVPDNHVVVPVLQAQDGSFVGEYGVWPDSGDDYVYTMVAFDATGNVRWMVPNERPQIATADGGVIGKSGITYDQNGSATGQMNLPTYSWLGNAYQVGSVDQVLANPLCLALSFWALLGGSNSGSGTAVNEQWYPELKSCTDKGGNCAAKQGQGICSGMQGTTW